MKKSHIAAAALACASAAFTDAAFAQGSVTIYGLADLGVDLQNGGAAGSIKKLSSGIQNGSRLGFKGSEDLGDGASALFVLEMGIAMDTGTLNQSGRGFGRQSFVGLKSSAGTLTMGRQYTAVNNALCGDIDPFGCGLAGTAGNLMSVGGTPTNDGNGSRTNNSVKYTAPPTAGFSGELTYAFGEVAASSKAGRTIGGSIGYETGPLTLRLAYNGVEDATGSNTAKVAIFGGRYNTGPAIVAVAYAINRGAFSSNTNIANPDSRDVLVGVTVPLGVSNLLASYIKKSDRSGNNDASQLALGYIYALSKRTNLYTSYAHIRNSAPNTNKADFYTVGNAIDGGTGDSAFNVGIRHAF